MNKSNIPKIIGIILVIILILIICIIILNKKNNVQNNNYENMYAINRDSSIISVKNKYECNEFKYMSVTIDELLNIYLNKYKNDISKNLERAYNMLDEDYRNKKFGNIEEFRKYVENNKEDILTTKLTSYQTKTDGENTRYICLSEKGNYYIFNETAVMDFSIILDTYTIDLPEFLEKYNVATDQQKVALNIDKFIQAINNKDYKYAYNCLADSYKNNYFKTELEFENYAKENFYENNTVGYKQFDKEGNLYTYLVILTDKSTGEQKNKTFIMQLGEGTEFVMSFDR